MLINCTSNNVCKNRFDFINSDNDSIPTLDLDLSKYDDTIREELNELYGYDLCQTCSKIDFRLPLIVDEREVLLRVMVDFDYSICPNCPFPNGFRNNLLIFINQSNKLLFDRNFIEIDSLQSKVEKHLTSNDGTELNIKIFWQQNSDIEFLRKTLAIIANSHLSFVESKTLESGKIFCELGKTSILNLKEMYPLNIEFDLGKAKNMRPSSTSIIKESEKL